MAAPLAANSIPLPPTTVTTPVLPSPRASSGSGPIEQLRESTFQALEESDKSQAGRFRRREELEGEEDRAGDREEQREQREQQREIRELAARDREVRAHEQAHASVGGIYAGSASLTYTRGPDGRSYATGGEVPIDVSTIPGEPEATLRKMQVVQRAALAPADPSAADRSIAAKAVQAQLTARSELTQQRAEEAAEQREARSERLTADGRGLSFSSRFESRLEATGALPARAESRPSGSLVDTRI